MLPSTQFTDEGKASLRELDIFVQRRIKRILKGVAKDPSLGTALGNELSGYFKCDSVAYRAIYTRVDSRIIVHLVAHRKGIYDRLLAALRRTTEDYQKSER